MDYVRSCYESSMRPYRDRPDILVPGRWYFCRPGAKPVKTTHVFSSLNWLPEGKNVQPIVGEAPPKGAYSKTPGPSTWTGQAYCGTDDAWLNGILYADRDKPLTHNDGSPCSCPPIPAPDVCLVTQVDFKHIVTQQGIGCLTPQP